MQYGSWLRIAASTTRGGVGKHLGGQLEQPSNLPSAEQLSPSNSSGNCHDSYVIASLVPSKNNNKWHGDIPTQVNMIGCSSNKVPILTATDVTAPFDLYVPALHIGLPPAM